MAKYTPKSETVYFLSVFDHTTPSLDGIVSEAVGAKYVGQQTGEMISNDTDLTVDMSSDDDIEEAMDSYGEGPYIDPRSGDRTYFNFESWLEALKTDPYFTQDTYGYKAERAAPDWNYALAWCVKNDLLPRGKYVLQVSW